MGKNTPIENITNSDILTFVAKRRACVSNATVNRQLQLLGRAIRHMAKFYKAKVPDLDLKAAENKEPKERIRELSQSEQSALFKHLSVEYHPFVKFALLTGARIATISNLRWQDINLPSGEMTFHLKGDDSMIFPISSEMRALLSSMPKSNILHERQYVFTRINAQTAERVRIVPNGGVFGTAFRLALQQAGIENFRFHDIRHTFATRVLRETKNIKLVSKLLGHKSIETTSKYAHVLVDDMRSAMEEFSALSGSVPRNNPQSVKLYDL